MFQHERRAASGFQVPYSTSWLGGHSTSSSIINEGQHESGVLKLLSPITHETFVWALHMWGGKPCVVVKSTKGMRVHAWKQLLMVTTPALVHAVSWPAVKKDCGSPCGNPTTWSSGAHSRLVFSHLVQPCQQCRASERRNPGWGIRSCELSSLSNRIPWFGSELIGPSFLWPDASSHLVIQWSCATMKYNSKSEALSPPSSRAAEGDKGNAATPTVPHQISE